MDAVYDNWREAPVSEATRAALGLIETLANHPAAVTREAIDEVRAAGVTDESIEDAIAASAVFHIIDRLADSFGFALPDDDGYAASAKVLLRAGYAFPPPVWWFA